MCLMKVGMERKDVSTWIHELFKFIQQIKIKTLYQIHHLHQGIFYLFPNVLELIEYDNIANTLC